MSTFPIITREDVRRTYTSLLRDDALWMLLSEISPSWQGSIKHRRIYSGSTDIAKFNIDSKYLVPVVQKAPEMYSVLLSLLSHGWTPTIQASVLDFYEILKDLDLSIWFMVENLYRYCYTVYDERIKCNDGENMELFDIPYSCREEDSTLILIIPFLVRMFQQMISFIEEYTEGEDKTLEPNYSYIKRELLERIWHPDLRILPDYIQDATD